MNWGIGFAIPAVAMAMAVVLFVAGHNRYTHQEPRGSPLERLVALSWAATVEVFRGGKRYEGLQAVPASPRDAAEV